MLRLRVQTSPAWLDAVMADFDSFLQDHASCERKASGTAMRMISHYADRRELVEAMIALAQEELLHFAQVYQLLAARNLILAVDTQDSYVRQLAALVRPRSEEYFLDRLLVAGVIEARGCERFLMLAEHLPPGDIKDFYLEITRSEARHHAIFTHLAKLYFPEDVVQKRLDEILEREAEIVTALPHRAAVH
jgi:tRNA-(ms[2]io[6]A)-hydroxylase